VQHRENLALGTQAVTTAANPKQKAVVWACGPPNQTSIRTNSMKCFTKQARTKFITG